MKKSLIQLVLISLIFLLFFIGCSAPDPSIEDGRKEEEKPTFIISDPSKWEENIDKDEEDLIQNILKKQTPKIDIDWYVSNFDKKVFTLTSGAELRGLAWLVNNNKDNFYEKIVNLKSNGKIDISDAPWIPIGEGSRTTYGKGEGNEEYVNDPNEVFRFSGTFDGGNVEISGLTNLDKSGNNGYFPKVSRMVNEKNPNNTQFVYGLFGLVRGEVKGEGENAIITNGIIKNVKLTDVNIKFDSLVEGLDENHNRTEAKYSPASIGSVVAQTRYGILMDNIKASGKIEVFLLSQTNIGGLLGRTSGQTSSYTKKIEISNSRNEVNIKVTREGDQELKCGGIVGLIYNVNYQFLNNLENIGKIEVVGTENAIKVDKDPTTQALNRRSYNIVGGIVGGLYNTSNAPGYSENDKVVLNDIVNNSTIDVNLSSLMGGVIGYSYIVLGEVNFSNLTISNNDSIINNGSNSRCGVIAGNISAEASKVSFKEVNIYQKASDSNIVTPLISDFRPKEVFLENTKLRGLSESGKIEESEDEAFVPSNKNILFNPIFNFTTVDIKNLDILLNKSGDINLFRIYKAGFDINPTTPRNFRFSNVKIKNIAYENKESFDGNLSLVYFDTFQEESEAEAKGLINKVIDDNSRLSFNDGTEVPLKEYI